MRFWGVFALVLNIAYYVSTHSSPRLVKLTNSPDTFPKLAGTSDWSSVRQVRIPYLPLRRVYAPAGCFCTILGSHVHFATNTTHSYDFGLI